MAFASIEPFGEERADLRASIIAAAAANSAFVKPRGKDMFEPKDFLPRWEPKRQQTAEEMKRMLRSR